MQLPERYKKVLECIVRENENYRNLPEFIRDSLDRYFVALVEKKTLAEVIERIDRDLKILIKISEEFKDILKELNIIERRFLLEDPEKCYKLLKLIEKSACKEFYLNKLLFCIRELDKIMEERNALVEFKILGNEKDPLLTRIWLKASDVTIEEVINFVKEFDPNALKIISRGRGEVISEIIKSREAREVVRKIWTETKRNRVMLLSDAVELPKEYFKYFVKVFDEYKEKFEKYGVDPGMLRLIQMRL